MGFNIPVKLLLKLLLSILFFRLIIAVRPSGFEKFLRNEKVKPLLEKYSNYELTQEVFPEKLQDSEIFISILLLWNVIWLRQILR